MKRHARPVRRSVLALAFSVLAVAGCGGGGSSKSTGPGTGGGPTFDLHFPDQNTSQQFTFADAGTWGYHCTAHSGMDGTVIVDAGSGNDSAVVQVSNASMDLAYFPNTVSIKPGGHIRWVNASTMTNHTVTRP
jgi:plastocyanin